MSFPCLKKSSGMLSSVFPNELVLFLYLLNYSVLHMNIYCLYYGYFILLNFSHLLATSTLCPESLKASFFMPFHISLIQLLEI